MTQVVNSYLQIVPDVLSCAMFAGQEPLPRCSLTELVSVGSARVPRLGPTTGRLMGRDRRWAAVAAKLPKDASTITSNSPRDQRKNRDANACFWLNLTIFRMNTCAKMVGGWGCGFSAATPTLLGFGCRTLRFQGCGFSMPGPPGAPGPPGRPGRRAIAPPARLRYSAAQGSGENV